MPQAVRIKPVTAKRKKVVTTGGSIVDSLAPMEPSETWMKTCIYGRSGTGKTRLASKWPKPMMWIPTEAGTKSIDKNPDAGEIDMPRLANGRPRIVKSLEEMQELLGLQRRESKYRTLVIDTGTGFQDTVVKMVTGREDIPEQLSWGEVSQSEWQQVAGILKDLFKSALDLCDTNECHVLLLNHEREFEPKEGAQLIMPSVMSAFTPSVAGWINPACDYVINTFIRRGPVKITEQVKMNGKMQTKTRTITKTEWCIRVGPDPVYVTKFRVPEGTLLPDYIANPTYPIIEQLCKGIYKPKAA